MRNGVGIANVDGAVRQDGSEERADNAVGLVGPPDVTIADIEYDKGVNPSRHTCRRWYKLQHCLTARPHYSDGAVLMDRREELRERGRERF